MLHNLIKINKGKSKRLGRGLGSGKGAKSGRGTSRHQESREKIPLWFEGGQNRLTKKFPLLRGKGKNKSIKNNITISLDRLNNVKDDSNITFKWLKKTGYLYRSLFKSKTSLKIVKGKEKLTKKIHIFVPVSESAKKEIIKAGGSTL